MKLFNVCLSKMPYLDLVHTTHGVVSQKTKKTVFSMRPVMSGGLLCGIITPSALTCTVCQVCNYDEIWDGEFSGQRVEFDKSVTKSSIATVINIYLKSIETMVKHMYMSPTRIMRMKGESIKIFFKLKGMGRSRSNLLSSLQGGTTNNPVSICSSLYLVTAEGSFMPIE